MNFSTSQFTYLTDMTPKIFAADASELGLKVGEPMPKTILLTSAITGSQVGFALSSVTEFDGEIIAWTYKSSKVSVQVNIFNDQEIK